MVRDTGQDNMWEGTMLSTGNHGLVPVNAMQPLPYPFYQWVTLCSSNEPLLLLMLVCVLEAAIWLICNLVRAFVKIRRAEVEMLLVHKWVPVTLLTLLLVWFRWFLRKYPGNTGCTPSEKEQFEHPLGKDLLLSFFFFLSQNFVDLSIYLCVIFVFEMWETISASYKHENQNLV